MRKKNVVLGLLACAVAVGSAFASLTMPVTMHVKAYTSQADFEEGILSCVNTGETCNDLGLGVSCAVRIQTSYGWVITSETRKDPQCALRPLTRSQGALPWSSIYVFALDE